MTKLTPYDTGARCEAKAWIPYGTKVTEATPASNFGKVDFENDSGETLCVAHVETNSDGLPVVMIQSLVNPGELKVIIEGEDSDVTLAQQLVDRAKTLRDEASALRPQDGAIDYDSALRLERALKLNRTAQLLEDTAHELKVNTQPAQMAGGSR